MELPKEAPFVVTVPKVASFATLGVAALVGIAGVQVLSQRFSFAGVAMAVFGGLAVAFSGTSLLSSDPVLAADSDGLWIRPRRERGVRFLPWRDVESVAVRHPPAGSGTRRGAARMQIGRAHV